MAVETTNLNFCYKIYYMRLVDDHLSLVRERFTHIIKLNCEIFAVFNSPTIRVNSECVREHMGYTERCLKGLGLGMCAT